MENSRHYKCFTFKKLAPMLISITMVGCVAGSSQKETNGIIVFQTDFGLSDGAVSEMKGVCLGVDSSLKLFDLTHEIPAYSIWDASYRLHQTYKYWPGSTVFVSVVDPGVGSERLSIVAKLKNGSFLVTPDNGTLTFLKDEVTAIRVIDESKNRLPGSEGSETFYGRDVYAYTAARLASGVIHYNEEVGEVSKKDPVILEYTKASIDENGLHGTIDILDVQYGNVWSNISTNLVKQYKMEIGKSYTVTIKNEGTEVYNGSIKYVKTFSDVPEQDELIYLNSLGNLALGVNQGSFAEKHSIKYGNTWSIHIK